MGIGNRSQVTGNREWDRLQGTGNRARIPTNAVGGDFGGGGCFTFGLIIAALFLVQGWRSSRVLSSGREGMKTSTNCVGGISCGFWRSSRVLSLVGKV